jgi:regulator of protease activity HflC (stomatin/prohibitin superfamily)
MTEITEETKSKFSVKRFGVGCGALFLGIVILALLALGIYVRSLIVFLEPDEYAVVISPFEPNGIREMPLTPGRQILRPMESLEIFKISREVFVSSSTDCNCGVNGTNSVKLRAKDGVDIIIDYRIIYVINAEQVIKLYQTWQHRYQNSFVIPTSRQVVKEITSQYTSNEIALTKREEIEKKIFSRLEPDFSGAYLILFEFKIDDVRLNE